MRDLAGRRVLVTGGTGFIGGRLVEKLILEQGAQVRVLTSNYAHAARVARFDLELVRGDVSDAAVVAHAAEGCDAILHCAYGATGSDVERRRVTVESTRAVLEAGVGPRAPRIVVVSTMVVYGVGIEGRLTESMPRRPTGLAYADAKIEAESLAFRYATERGVAVSVVQPTAVYGPYAPSWTVRVLRDLGSGLVVLVDGGVGHANPVYIDDVADAILLASTRDEAVGEAFLVSGGETVTWKEFYARFEAMLGFSSTINLSSADARAHYARSRRRQWFVMDLLALVRENSAVRKRLAGTRELAALYPMLKKIAGPRRSRPAARASQGAPQAPRARPDAPAKRILPVHPQQVDFLAAKTDVRIDKARRLLGFEPAFGFARGMAATEAWARWANLLDGDGRT